MGGAKPRPREEGDRRPEDEAAEEGGNGGGAASADLSDGKRLRSRIYDPLGRHKTARVISCFIISTFPLASPSTFHASASSTSAEHNLG